MYKEIINEANIFLTIIIEKLNASLHYLLYDNLEGITARIMLYHGCVK